MRITSKRSQIINKHLSAHDKKQVASLLGVSYSYIWQLLKGKRPITTKRAVQLIKVLIQKAKQNRDLKAKINLQVQDQQIQTISHATKIIFSTHSGEKITIDAQNHPSIIQSSIQSIQQNQAK